MAETKDIRSIKEILEEMFAGKDAALLKYARVRHTQYEINLWRRYGLPLNEVDGSAKAYLSKRFINGANLRNASEAEISKALEQLDHAVKDGCHGRCERLVVELNSALSELGLPLVENVEKFLDYLTFSYEVQKDYEGNDVVERPYGFEIRIFNDAENRREFWSEAQALLKSGKMMSMQDITRIVLTKRKKSVILEK